MVLFFSCKFKNVTQFSSVYAGQGFSALLYTKSVNIPLLSHFTDFMTDVKRCYEYTSTFL